MPKGKAEKIDLSHLDFEEAVRQAWEAEPPPKDERKSSPKRGKTDEKEKVERTEKP